MKEILATSKVWLVEGRMKGQVALILATHSLSMRIPAALKLYRAKPWAGKVEILMAKRMAFL